MILVILASEIEKYSWHEAIQKAIERIGHTGRTTGFKTFINDVLYDNHNSNQDGMCYKACKMGLKIEQYKDFKYELVQK